MKSANDIITEAIDKCLAGPTSANSRFAARQVARVIERELWNKGYTIVLEAETFNDESN